ncbi:MAG: putative DNA-binding domain-containing protein [Comamonadaceae bacterium]|nr:putative DNA-binding domain-containing protein [Comamonadaceae bacterium]
MNAAAASLPLPPQALAPQAPTDAQTEASTAAFYDYVRGRTNAVPPGYTEAGLRVYRYLVYLGASQMIEAHHPALRAQLGEESWRTLIEAFVRDSRWQSNFYEDLNDAFNDFLARASQ